MKRNISHQSGKLHRLIYLSLIAISLSLSSAQGAPYLVKGLNGLTLVQLRRAVISVGGIVLDTVALDYSNFGYVALSAELTNLQLRSLLATQNAQTEGLFINYLSGDLAVAKAQACESIATPWAIDQIDGVNDGVYSQPMTAKPVHVYMLDSGMHSSHCEFTVGKGNGKLNIAATGPLQASTHPGNAHTTDQLGHGTAVASCIVGQRVGVASGTSIVLHPYGVFGLQPTAIASVLIGGIYEAIEDHDLRAINDDPYDNASIINLSLVSETKQASCQVEEALNTALSKGMVVIAAAGNTASAVPLASDCEGFNLSEDPEEGYSPARLDDVFTVAAATDQGMRWLVNKSRGSNIGGAVDLYGPGHNLALATRNGNTQLLPGQAGTSYATAYVTGIAANILSCNPLATPAEIGAQLKASAVNGGGVGVKLARQNSNSMPTIEASFNQWLKAYAFPPGENSDSDGVPLALEFFAGRNATVNDAAPVLWTQINQSTIDFYYVKARYVGPVHTQVTIEQSSNLENWSPSGVVATPVSGDCFVQTYKGSIPIGSGTKYLRLKVVTQ